MLIYTRVYNSALGQLEQVATEMVIAYRSSVSTMANLPVSATAGDFRMAIDTDHAFVYVNGTWHDQGVFDVSDLLQQRLMQELS